VKAIVMSGKSLLLAAHLSFAEFMFLLVLKKRLQTVIFDL